MSFPFESALTPPVPMDGVQPWSDEDEAAWQELHRDDPDGLFLDLDEALPLDQDEVQS